MAVSSLTPKTAAIGWRTPAVVVLCGCICAIVSFGPRATLGFFLTPMSQEYHWGRDVFGLAIAIQNILWGLAGPLAGMMADRFGVVRVLWTGAVLYAIGLALMAFSTTPALLHLSAGVFIGLGLACSSFSIVLSAFGKLLPERMRSFAFGAGAAAGSFGQFLYSPLAVALIDVVGWQNALLTFALLMLVIVPASLVLGTGGAGQGGAHGVPQQSLRQALAEAIAHRSYVLLVIGFFTCGFQLSFITIHMPPYLVDQGLASSVGGWTIAVIGLFNIFGSLMSGWLATFLPKRFILSAIYFSRAMAILAFISFPVTPFTSIMFGASMGLLWLSTVAPTQGLIALMFGTRWLATLAGFAFFSHQVGGFLGVWLGGIVFERTGSYDMVWWLAILFGVLSAVINLPIVEKPVVRAAAAVPA